jgi:hypothetical protein
LKNGAVSETLFIAFFRTRFSSKGSGTVSTAKAVNCFSYGERFTATIPLHAVIIANCYHYSCNKSPECLYYHKKHMHSLVIKAKGGTEHRWEKEKKHREQGKKKGEN